MHKDKNTIILQYHKNRSPELKEKIVVSYRSLVEYIARKLAYNKSDIDDLIQVGTIGLLKSIDRFEPKKDIDFSTFATPNIIGEIKHYFRDKSHLIKIPRRLQETYTKIKNFIKLESVKEGKSPTIQEIALALDITEEEVLESLDAGQTSHVISLDSPAYSKSDSFSGDGTPSLLDSLGVNANEDSIINEEILKGALEKLNEREKKIIYLRFYEGLTQTEIAIKLELSQMHISRLLQFSLEQLRRHLQIETDKIKKSFQKK